MAELTGDSFEELDSLRVAYERENELFEQASRFYEKDDFYSAVEIYKRLSDQKLHLASLKAGNCYKKLGQIELAEKYWILAAENGYSAAAQNLGKFYLSNNQIDQAKKYFEQGAAAGRGDSMHELAKLAISYGTKQQSDVWLRKSAETGFGPALYDLARDFYLQQDYEEALELAELAKEAGYALADQLITEIKAALPKQEAQEKPESGHQQSSSYTRENIYGFQQSGSTTSKPSPSYSQPKPKPSPKFTVMSEAEEAAGVWMRYMGFNAKVGGRTTAADKGIDVWSDAAVAQVKMHGKPVGSQMLHTFDSQANLHARNRKKLFFSWNGYNSGAIDVADQLGIYLFHMYSHGDLKPINHLAKKLWSQAG